MRRTDIDDDGAEILPGTSAPSSGPPLGPTVIAFRRANPPPRRPVADDTPPVSSAPFQPLGEAVAAVVVRLRGGFPKVKVLAAGPREEAKDRQP